MEGPSRRVRVRHTTTYHYDNPVERSEHWLHLRPVHDWRQHIVSSRISLDPAVELVEFEDVFGNAASRCVVAGPYTELKIEAESIVDVVEIDPFAFSRRPINRPTFPISWMPWEHTVLSPYLIPEELPPTQLRELNDYARSFVKANRYDVMETLFNINLELFRNYRYTPGSTTLATNPYDVLRSRQGVCQDFSNLFIMLARLLGIPARYVCGYIYTGNTGDTRAGSDASHAWVQLYIPDIGWKGFDPTNGNLPQLDHIRVAVGRHYRDTAPITGTIFGGGGGERMGIEVQVTEIAPPTEVRPVVPSVVVSQV
jgi:transglutaminase-like putative cysteine protease